jgi:hypothetical protein
MDETPTPEELERSEEYLAVVEAIEKALLWLLTDEPYTEEEVESLSADLHEVAYLALDAFDAQVLGTMKNGDGSQSFIFQMTIPDRDLSDYMKEHYDNNVDYDEEDAENEDD